MGENVSVIYTFLVLFVVDRMSFKCVRVEARKVKKKASYNRIVLFSFVLLFDLYICLVSRKTVSLVDIMFVRK